MSFRRAVLQEILLVTSVIFLLAGVGYSQSSPENEGVSYVRKQRDLYASRAKLNSTLFWVLSIAAAGTAISTAIRSASTGNRDANTGNGGKADKVILILSISTVIATTIISTVNPKELATRYTFGYLTIENALVAYDMSSKSDSDRAEVRKAFELSQHVLAYGVEPLAKQSQPSSTLPKAETATKPESAAPSNNSNAPSSSTTPPKEAK